jgi:phospholipid/cholesterol/gamma-HCH transport system substrate-binding protein
VSTRLRFSALLALVLAVGLSGCSFTGINSYPLPFTKGGGANDIKATVYLENAANLVPNSEVKYKELTIGSVRKIEFDHGRAKLTIGVERTADIPADITAKVAQKSLLGAEYLELSSDAAPTATRLTSGAVLNLDRTGRYPETEEVLAGAAMLLNGGGLPQIRTITHELNAALDGRQGDARSLIARLVTFTSSLDEQKQSILRAIEQTDRLAGVLAKNSGTVSRALEQLPEGVATLARERAQLVRTLESLSQFGDIAHRVVTETRSDLTATLNNLRPVTKSLADSGQNLIKAAEAITYPFPTRAVDKSFFGDYINLFVTFDVNPKDFVRTFLGGTPLEGLYTGFIGGLPTGTAGQALDPLLNPLLGPQGQYLGNIGKNLTGLSGGTKGGTKPATPSAPSAPVPTPSPTATPTRQPNLLELLLGGGR